MPVLCDSFELTSSSILQINRPKYHFCLNIVHNIPPFYTICNGNKTSSNTNRHEGKYFLQSILIEILQYCDTLIVKKTFFHSYRFSSQDADVTPAKATDLSKSTTTAPANNASPSTKLANGSGQTAVPGEVSKVLKLFCCLYHIPSKKSTLA